MLKQAIEADIKSAMLAGDKDKATTLRGLKSAILYEEVALGLRETGLNEQQLISVLQKEAKKRLESAELYTQGGAHDRANKELAEKKIIDNYLPEQLSEDELSLLIQQAISELGVDSMQGMGKVIGNVKLSSEGRADGAKIAAMVKQILEAKN